MAAANASCFAMALSHALTQAGHPPEALTVNATCSLDRNPEGGLRISKMQLNVSGRVPGIDEAEFERFARQAGTNCPVSKALHHNVELQVTARLQEPEAARAS